MVGKEMNNYWKIKKKKTKQMEHVKKLRNQWKERGEEETRYIEREF